MNPADSTHIYLFDWGDTLMADLPGYTGPMKDWETVVAMPGARETLQTLSSVSPLFVATGSPDTKAEWIQAALSRVELDSYISGYFCPANIGYPKNSPAFYQTILERLAVPPDQVTMVGDTLEKDVLPPLSIGMHAVLVSRQDHGTEQNYRVIRSLVELC